MRTGAIKLFSARCGEDSHDLIVHGTWEYRVLNHENTISARSHSGPMTLEAEHIARQFGLSVAELERYYNRGAISVSSSEKAGIRYIQYRLGNRVWQAITDPQGRLLCEETRFPRGKRASQNPSR